MIVLAILAAISLAALLAWLSGDGAPADEVSRITCGAADGSWPCVSRQVADDLRRAIGDE